MFDIEIAPIIRRAKLVWTDDRFCAKLFPLTDKIYEIGNPSELLQSGIIYSTPNNDKHPAWTARQISKVKTDLMIKYWSSFKHGATIKGYIKEDMFYVR